MVEKQAKGGRSPVLNKYSTLYLRANINCHTVSLNTPKLESCWGVSVSLYDVALKSLGALGRACPQASFEEPGSPRVHHVWSYQHNLFQMLLLKFL